MVSEHYVFSCCFSFSPGGSPHRGTADTKSPAFPFSLNSDSSSPGFSGFGFDMDSSQDEVRNEQNKYGIFLSEICVGFGITSQFLCRTQLSLSQAPFSMRR